MQNKKIYSLTVEQIDEVEALYKACVALDGLAAALSLDCSVNCDPTLPAFYLQYEQEQLVSFLMVFMPDPSEAEMFAMTLPKYRRQGRCRMLMLEASRELRKRGLVESLIQCEPDSEAAIAAIKHLEGTHAFSEYTMYRPLEQGDAAEGGISLKPASSDDLEALSALAGEIFQDDPSVHRSMFEKSFASDEISILEAWRKDRCVGLTRIVWSDTPPNICTFGIRPDCRKQGLGEAFLGLLLNHIAAKGYVEAGLDVNSENDAALRLYQRKGFLVRVQVNYYALPLIQG